VKQSISRFLQRDRKKLAVLIDPDKAGISHLERVCKNAMAADVDAFLVGGSLITNGRMPETIHYLKRNTNIPVIIFPGHPGQVCSEADAILLLSLISGRNPELLIGQHVIAAPVLKKSGLDILPTGYMLIDGGKITSVMYISNTVPIPHDKYDIAVCTAMAGEMLGLKHIYLEAGSGAERTVDPSMVEQVRGAVHAFLWVGGGIRHPEHAWKLASVGADCLVVGTAAEEDATILQDIAVAVRSVQPILHS